MLEDAEIFVSVVDNHSFSKAARQLKLSAPIITRHIAKLENTLGVRLLQRNTRQVSLTEAGTIFYESCLAILQTYTTSLKQVKNLSSQLVGTLKIGLPASISYLHISPVINKFLKKYPDLNIHIVNGNHLLDLLSAGFDFIVHCGELSDSNLYCKKLGTWTKAICASPSYLKNFGVPKNPDDLRHHNCLDHYDNRDNTWEFLIDGHIHDVPVRGNIRSNTSLDLKNLAVAGLGITYLPSFTVKHEIANGSLKKILTRYQPPPLNLYAVYPSNKFLNKKTKVFIDFLNTIGLSD